MTMFTVAGLSRQNGSLKLRFANDFVTRSKVLARNKHTDINLVELPQAMTKDAAVAYVSTLTQFADVESQAVLTEFQNKNAKSAPKAVAAAPKAKAPKAVKQTEVDHA
jgi:hypothetical protein